MVAPLDATDTELLSYLAAIGQSTTPATVTADHDYDFSTVLARLDGLVERGLVRTEGDGTYKITSEGLAYLRGDRDAVERAGGVPGYDDREPSWMETGDVPLLEALADSDEPVAASALSAAIDRPVEHVRARCEELAAQGLVQPVDADTYRLRDLGEAFVAGDLNPAFLET